LNPARADEILILFLTGLGAVDAPQVTGNPVTQATSTVRSPRVVVAGQDASILYSGLAPGFAGLYQINFQVQASLAPGDWPLVVIAVVDSNQVIIPVR
jgi:uncharacterized protein (TIGR03437 family)